MSGPVKHTATIVLTDDGTDEVHIKCEFDPSATDESGAHRTAMSMLAKAVADDSKEPTHV